MTPHLLHFRPHHRLALLHT